MMRSSAEAATLTIGMTTRSIFLALLLTACEEPQGRSDEIPYLTLPGLPSHAPATIDATEEILGLALVPWVPGHGGILVILHESTGEVRGELSEVVDRCALVIWAEESPRVLAHELGHALGLQHSDDLNNVMSVGHSASEITDEQVDVMRWSAWYIWHEC